MSFKTFCEALETINFRGRPLIWNPDKTDAEFKKRIKERTGMSEVEFYSTLKSGLVKGNDVILTKGVICVYFTKSRFVLILNMNKHQITTIRDAFWDKPSNGCDKKVFVTESVMDDYIDNVFFNEAEFEGYSLDMVMGEKWTIEIKHHCDVCVEVDA